LFHILIINILPEYYCFFDTQNFLFCMKSIKNFYGIFLFLLFISVLPGKVFAQVPHTITLKATKSYNPDQYFDFDTTLSVPVKIIIPEYLSVTEGSAGDGLAMLKFYNVSSGDSTTIIYKGIAENSLAPGQLKKGMKYYFQSSSNGVKAGDLSSTTTRVYLRVESGNSLAGSTTIAQSVNAPISGNCDGYHIYSSQGGDLAVDDGIYVCLNKPFTLTTTGVPDPLIVTFQQYWVGGNSGGLSQSALCGGGNGQQFTTNFCKCDANYNIDCDNFMIVNIIDPISGGNSVCTIECGIDITTNTVIASGSTTICPGSSANLSASGSPYGAYTWTDPDGAIIGTTANITVYPTKTTVYTVKSGCGADQVTVTVKPDACCIPTGATTWTTYNLGTPGTPYKIDASLYGGTVVFNGNYHLLGSLQLTNGNFFLLPGTVFTIDQTTDLSTPINLGFGAWIQVLDANLNIGGATLQSDLSLPVSTSIWGGIILQNSTIHTEACGQRAKIYNAKFGILLVSDPVTSINNNHYFINNTDFIDNRWFSIWDIEKASAIQTGEGITNCNFKAPFWYNPQNIGIYIANSHPRTIGTLPVDNNYFETIGTGIYNDYDFAVIEKCTLKTVAAGIVINSASSQHIIRNNQIELDGSGAWVGISDGAHGLGRITGNTIIGHNLSGELGIEAGPGSIVQNNTVMNTGAGIKGNWFTIDGADLSSNTLTHNNAAISVPPSPYTPPQPISARCNTIDNSGLSGTSYGIFVDQNAYLNDLGGDGTAATNFKLPNGNAFIGFKNTTNRIPMEYEGPGANTFHYYKSTSLQENFLDVTNSGNILSGAVLVTSVVPGCAPGSGVGFRLAANSPLSAQDSVNAAMDSLRFQLGDFRKMKTWQGEILSYFEKNNNLDGLYSYADTLKGCNLEAYNTFMLYLMNKYDITNHCSKGHDCANEVLNANPNDAEIQARTTYFNYECRQRHGGNRTFILPFMPMNPQDSTDLTAVAISGTSLSRTACMQLRRHNPRMSCNTTNTYKPNYPDCGPDCKKRKNEFLKKGWEKNTGFKADKQGGQLSQNIPNPAENETIIPYIIPGESFTSAYITIQSVVNGTQVKRIELPQTGYGAVSINLENLPSGVYTYTLVVDGIKQDVKRMVVVK
jgi:hypothetical protein